MLLYLGKGQQQYLVGVLCYKKCKDLLSMAINGKQVKNQILTELLTWLWLGKVERAIKLLQDVSQDQMKNKKELNNFMSHPEFLKQKFEKAGVQRAELSAGVRGVPEKLFFPFFLAPPQAVRERKRSGAQPHTPSKGLAALCNPARQAA
jgi:hypothetical protein